MNQNSFLFYCLFSILLRFQNLSVQANGSLDDLIQTTCNSGDLKNLLIESQKFINSNLTSIESASILHILSNLALILNADTNKAVEYHKQAKAFDAKTLPPLAKLHINGNSCGGVSDLYYVTAVSIKQLVDSYPTHTEDILSEKTYFQNKLTAHTTLLTLLSDSGYHDEAEIHLIEALRLNPSDSNLLIRSVLMTPGLYESTEHINSTRELLSERIDKLLQERSFRLDSLDEFTLSPTFYFAYQGYNDQHILVKLREIYDRGYPEMNSILIPHNYNEKTSTKFERNNNKIKIGFVSSYFRQHSVCKLFCGIIENLNRSKFDVHIFSASSAKGTNDSVIEKLKKNSKVFIFGKTLVHNRNILTENSIDVLVYLDIGMEPSIVVWASARLAPVQIALWGHPSTTGMNSIDYFISSDLYHSKGLNSGQEFFYEQLIRLDSLGFFFRRPILSIWMDEIRSKINLKEISCIDVNDDEDCLGSYYEKSLIDRSQGLYQFLFSRKSSLPNSIKNLIKLKIEKNTTIVLCPQHLPKFHPKFDEILSMVLSTQKNSVLVLLAPSNKIVWKNTLTKRWNKFYKESITEDRLVWIESLKYEEYLSLLAIGDIMLDPFPFGGGVTILESLGLLTPIITFPDNQTVPELASGMIHTLFNTIPRNLDHLSVHISNLIVGSHNFTSLIGDLVDNQVHYRRALSYSVNSLFDQRASIVEWESVIENIYRTLL